MAQPDIPGERALRARIAAHESWAATTDRTGRTAPARRAFHDRFLNQVDPAITDPVDRAQAAEHLRKAYFTRLALRSAQARRRKGPVATGPAGSVGTVAVEPETRRQAPRPASRDSVGDDRGAA